MVWVRTDEKLHHEPEFVEAGPLALALFLAGLGHSNDHGTDGFITRRVAVRRLIDFEVEVAPGQMVDVDPDFIIGKLLAAQCSECDGDVVAMRWTQVDGGYLIHDHNQPTREQMLEQQEKKAEAGRKGGYAKAQAKTRDEAESKQTSSSGLARASGVPDDPLWQTPSKPLADPIRTVTEPKSSTPPTPPRGGPPTPATPEVAAQARPVSVDTRAVFDAWRQSTGRTSRTRLDDKRRRVIQRALRAYPLDDVLAAVTGWRNDPWPDRVRHNDLTVLLRDAAHIEKFRDLANHGPPAPAGSPSGFGRQREQLYANDQAAQAWVAMQQQEPQHDHDPGGLAAGLQPHQRELAQPAAPA